MINKSNLKNVLSCLGFSIKSSDIYEKHYHTVDCTITVDFKNEIIIYPTEKGFIVNDTTTCNFSKNENFVVLECVNRLLDKGYRPEHIQLEKKWQVGHDEKGGKADICVSDINNKDVLFIVECKTPGKEYKDALSILQNDNSGGQLFSYWQQERSTKWLVMYASDFDGSTIYYFNESVRCTDDANILKLSKKDASIQTYRDASTVEQLHSVWKETYNGDYYGDIVFDEDAQAYNIGMKLLKKKNLIDFSSDDKIVNRFEEILRHNNVSDKENAFNRLVALFICKLADEISKKDEDIVDFQYKTGTDTYESLQDRLQKLHQQGMAEFMKEEIFYISDDYAEKVITQYTGQKREKLISELNKTLRILKFYTNNDFSFKDVHNEELFYQNGKILVEVVKLFQGFRIIDSNSLQLLGDLFEQLLNKGFKQNEGQFFTPTLITRFIWESLPLDSILFENGKEIHYPKIIDYACGAGHFLTEGYDSIKDRLIEKNVTINKEWPTTKIYGIEKDYRLARVSKISLFMHGAGNGNIVFGDGLENYYNKNIDPNTFDVLVANPPYSVSGFKPHMKLKDNSLTILDYISDDGSEIETLFVERISQLVKSEGYVAVVLPSSILNKENNSFIKARELILKNFNIVSIVSFGSKTFGATGTPTIVMFLRKFSEPPKRSEIICDSIDAIFSSKDTKDWEDSEISHQYTDRIGVHFDEYNKFINETLCLNELRQIKYFNELVNSYFSSTDYKTKTSSKSFKKLADVEKEQSITKSFYYFAKQIEKEKVFYFALTYKQETTVVVLPNDNEEQEKFLGYKWSNRKGQEGIQVVRPGGRLYNPKNYYDENNVSGLIRNAFLGKAISPSLIDGSYFVEKLHKLLDFDRINFAKNIKLVRARKFRTDSEYKLYSLSDPIFSVSHGDRVLSDEVQETGSVPVISANVCSNVGYFEKRNITDFSTASILWGIDGNWMVNLIEPNKEFYPTDHCGVLRCTSTEVNSKYLMYSLMVAGEYEMFSRWNRASDTRIKSLKIQIPSLKTQNAIIEELDKIDESIKQCNDEIEKINSEVKQYFNTIFSSKIATGELNKLSDVFDIQLGKTPSRKNYEYWIDGDNSWISISDIGKYDVFTSDTKEQITELAIKEENMKFVPENTVIMSFKLTIGKTAITSEKIMTNEAIVAFLPKKEASPIFYKYYFETYDWTKDSMNAVKGVTLNSTSINNALIYIPEQSDVEKFELKFNEAQINKNKIKDSIKSLESNKEDLITKYFR